MKNLLFPALLLGGLWYLFGQSVRLSVESIDWGKRSTRFLVNGKEYFYSWPPSGIPSAMAIPAGRKYLNVGLINGQLEWWFDKPGGARNIIKQARP